MSISWQKLLPSLLIFLFAQEGFAQSSIEREVDLQLFHPATDSRGLLTRDRSETLEQFDFSLGLWFSFSQKPFELNDEDIAEHLLTSHFQFSYGIFDFLEAGVNVPFSLVDGPRQDPLGGPALFAQGVGDIGFHLKGQFVKTRQNRLGVGALLKAYLPTGDEQNFLSSGSLTVSPQFIADTLLWRRLKLTANIGANFRKEGVVQDVVGNEIIRVGNQALLGVGASYTILVNRVDLVAETQVLTPLTQPFSSVLTTPVESTLGIKLFLEGNSFLTIGTGIGLNQAYGVPDIRGFLGITFEPVVGDLDGDGYNDREDDCPAVPEDFDGFQDEDGCPESDNDDDGILDIDDQCPNIPGEEEFLGCPKPPDPLDSDGDGLLDYEDDCPLEPEDFDGFQDEDGCPEPDNDDDGILDADDLCPEEPEDFDNFQGEDGCPDPDNDKDGILDIDDQCPDLKGVPEKNGCPKLTITQTGTTLTMEPIRFDYNKATIRKDSYQLLSDLAELLRDNPQLKNIRVEGHTDADGSDDYNQRLSDARARSVVSYLIRKQVKKKRLFAKGFGETCPITENETDQGKATNRRVEFIILQDTTDLTDICNAKKVGQSP